TVKFYRTMQSFGIKPIVGADLNIADDGDAENTGQMQFLCQNREGYQNLTRLITRSYIEGQVRGVPRVSKKWLRELHHGLIAISCARTGVIGQEIIDNDMQVA
ncbi:MAG: PHP domain-containing protein, partial [Gammaproteobacteria bacterium]